MNAYRNASFVGIVLMLAGLGLSIYAGSFLREEMELNRKGIVVKGKVFEIEKRDFYRQPWVVFTTKRGEQVRFLSKLMADVSLFKYRVGQQVDVIYDPANPRRTAEINSFFERNTRQLWVGFLGVVLILVGFLFRLAMRRKARRYDAQMRGQVPYNPWAARASLNRIMLVTFLVICLIIGIFVYVYAVHGNLGIWNGVPAKG